MQKHESIERVLLFCGNKTRASNLTRSFPKIQLACFSYTEVLKTLNQWSREQTKSIYFVEEHSISGLHVGVTNWLSLTNTDFSPKKDDVFFKFCKEVLMRVKAPKTTAILDRVKEKKDLVEHLLSTDFLLDEMNKLLQSTCDPTKLACILWPVC